MATLARVLPDCRLLIVTGKGGVGRSAVTAALARLRAETGRRVLVMAMGQGDGLAAHLGLDTLGPVPQRAYEGLEACTVDPAVALDEYVRLRVKAFPLRAAGRVFRVLAQAVPGVRDLVVIGKCIYQSSRPAWDTVIVDGSPTGQIESALLAPTVIEGLAPRGRVHDEAVSLRRTLSDPSLTGLIVVSTPEELALTEAATFSAMARQSGLTPTVGLIINRVLSSPGFESAPPEPGSVADAAELHLALLQNQGDLLAEVEADALLPFVFGADRPALVAKKLVDGLRP